MSHSTAYLNSSTTFSHLNGYALLRLILAVGLICALALWPWATAYQRGPQIELISFLGQLLGFAAFIVVLQNLRLPSDPDRLARVYLCLMLAAVFSAELAAKPGFMHSAAPYLVAGPLAAVELQLLGLMPAI